MNIATVLVTLTWLFLRIFLENFGNFLYKHLVTLKERILGILFNTRPMYSMLQAKQGLAFMKQIFFTQTTFLTIGSRTYAIPFRNLPNNISYNDPNLNRPNLASFCLFLFFSHDKYSTNLIINDKNIDVCLGLEPGAAVS